MFVSYIFTFIVRLHENNVLKSEKFFLPSFLKNFVYKWQSCQNNPHSQGDLLKLQSDIANYWPGMHSVFSKETHACLYTEHIILLHLTSPSSQICIFLFFFIQQFLLFSVSLWCVFTRVCLRVVLVTQESAFWCRTRMRSGLFASREMHMHASWYCRERCERVNWHGREQMIE